MHVRAGDLGQASPAPLTDNLPFQQTLGFLPSILAGLLLRVALNERRGDGLDKVALRFGRALCFLSGRSRRDLGLLFGRSRIVPTHQRQSRFGRQLACGLKAKIGGTKRQLLGIACEAIAKRPTRRAARLKDVEKTSGMSVWDLPALLRRSERVERELCQILSHALPCASRVTKMACLMMLPCV